ncbi:MAG TPA: hypothetical protein VHZ33_33450 [Trebonia sp.]|jgi:hypothetical protein|nr:hypothetical protein [Trebonia sp.]
MTIHAQHVRRTAGGFAVAAAAAGLVLTGCGKTNSASAPAASTSAGAATSAAATSGSGSTASAAATSSGSQSSVVVSSGAAPFPTTVGDTWKYSNSNGSTSENKIASNTQVAGGQQVTMATTFTDNGSSTHASYDYIVQPNGEISLPTSQFAPASAGVSIKVLSGGIYWPSAAQLAGGQPVHTTLTMEFTIAGKTQKITEHITSQGQGTQSVTVPAGTYSATVVNVQEVASIEGFKTTIDDKTWLANGVGPVQSELISIDGGKTDITNKEELTSFVKG